jgi:hypothetical protein
MKDIANVRKLNYLYIFMHGKYPRLVLVAATAQTRTSWDFYYFFLVLVCDEDLMA